jgi:hypothetical protein
MASMSEKHLHIISFDIPWPANYGGVIDVFYKAKELSEKGVKVHLHCFEYGRSYNGKLKSLFYKVHYYKRDISKKHLFKSIPYIVSTRVSEELATNLLQDNYPVLMEGIHTSALLNDPRFTGRKRLVRTHNIEHDYYQNLGKAETDLFKKYYFFNEAAKLKRYEHTLDKADALIAISKNDYNYFSSKFDKVEFIPAFHPHSAIHCKEGKGDYVLYHGNLSVSENYNAVKYLATKVFNNLPYTLKVAGLNPPKHLVQLINNYPNIELIENPDDQTLEQLISDAHINVAVTAQATGLKLKLLNTLYNGRFCLVNDKMLSGSKLDKLTIIANEAAGMKHAIKNLFSKTFTSADIEERKHLLGIIYNNGDNVQKLIELIF